MKQKLQAPKLRRYVITLVEDTKSPIVIMADLTQRSASDLSKLGWSVRSAW